MDMLIHARGDITAIYSEQFDFAMLGHPKIRRVSHVEPDSEGRWWADLAPVRGPSLGPFALRSAALAAESTWLGDHLATLPPVRVVV